MPLPASKRDPTVAAVLRRWRALTGGVRVPDADRPTLVACSGGADSVALAVALHAAGGLAGLAHVVHDLRSPEEAGGDRDFVAGLASRLGTPFFERSVSVRTIPGSVEAAARRLRYLAIEEIARESQCRLVATAHHADDQFETLIMRLARGSGPRGLRGILPRRRFADSGTVVIRPCLDVRRSDLLGLCASLEISPRIDASNADTAYTRNALRATIIPELERLFPGVASRAGELSARMRSLEHAINHEASMLIARSTLRTPGVLSRVVLREAQPAVLHAALRQVARGGGRSADNMSWRAGERLVAAVRDPKGGVRRIEWGPAEVTIESDRVTVRLRTRRQV